MHLHLHHAISFQALSTTPPASSNSVSHIPNALKHPTRPPLPAAGKTAEAYFYSSSVPKRCGTEIFLPKLRLNSPSIRNCSRIREGNGHIVKEIDVATMGNLCVDIVLNVPKLPPKPPSQRKAYLDEISNSSPDKRYWEAGGNCNMAIAAARLGLSCVTIGHVGDEIYGHFLLDVLNDEGISIVGMNEEINAACGSSTDYETLLCWVLVDPFQNHGFCSRADFSADPAFNWLKQLAPSVKKAIKESKVLFCNGYGFDEFSPDVLTSALHYAVEAGTSIFFDPGPRGKTLISGSPDERKALDQLLKFSDVLLLTSEEAESLTGIANPTLAGQELLRMGVRTRWVIVKMGSMGSLLMSSSSVSYAPAFKVDVVDTVGCGDSFVAAIVYGFIHSMPQVHTLALANAVGAATAMGCGAGRNVANLNKVIELMTTSNLNENDEFCLRLLDVDSDMEVTLLSKAAMNGSNSNLKRVFLKNVVSELLPKLRFTCMTRAVRT